MNRLFLIKDNDINEISQNDYQIIKKYLNICNKSLGNTKLYWCSELKKRTINAAFVQYKPNSIFLNRPRNPFDLLPKNLKLSDSQRSFYQDIYEENLMQIVPYVAHELTHQQQYRKYGRILYGIFCLPGLYPLILDKPAFRNEEIAASNLRLNVRLYGKLKTRT